MSLRIVLLCASWAFLPGCAAGPVVPRDALGEERPLAKLDLWVGHWQGSGWSEFPGGPRQDFELTESVQEKVGGSVLLVEGRGTTRGERGERVVTHEGLVLVDFDRRTGRYRWHGYDLGRDPIEVEPEVRDGGLVWSLVTDDGKATLRFTLEFDAREWREVGELSSDGEHWTKFMAMTLTRQV